MSSATLVPSAPAAVFPAAAAGSAGGTMAPAEFRPPSSAPAANRVPAVAGQKRPAANDTAAPPPPSRRIRTEEPVWQRAGLGSQYRRFIRRDDNPSPEEVDRRLARFMDSMVEEEDRYNRTQMWNCRKPFGGMQAVSDSEDDPIDLFHDDDGEGEERIEEEETETEADMQ
ncbi:uncharacterized protein PG986_006433 [Apiospora aurea]|uniref:Uncharacterized protein n=1 Tax=Apiospora aurea TaxID=335848 RepID=A0ABR1QKE8_9PEZI